jgi:hypothetical protein
MALLMKEFIMKDNLMVRVLFIGQMDLFILDNGRKVSCMVRVFYIIKMVQHMRV